MDTEILKPYLFIEEVYRLVKGNKQKRVLLLHIRFKLDPELPYVLPPRQTPGRRRSEYNRNERIVTIKVAPVVKSLAASFERPHGDASFYDIITLRERSIRGEDSVRVQIIHGTRNTHGGSGCIHYPPGVGD
ncbi:MAG: hypothetical protein HEP71_28960 [Roseivirga sp.]|nr:hypothetical protein [Roseivirga sp.]